MTSHVTGAAAPGTLVTPSLELTRRIGAGGMGTVWVAFHRGLRKEVAVKLMAESILSSEELRSRFAEEAVAGANVKSPHVVQVFDTGASEALGPYIVMELLEGQDLGARLARDGVLTPAHVTRLVAQAAHALDRAHAIGIVHRDIKPPNLFLCVEEGAPFTTKVLDFGVATLRQGATPLTRVGTSVGTPMYMSPEQAAASRDLDGKSDLYALGLVAFRALTGTAAFPRESIEALGLGVYNLPPPKLTERRSSLPRAVDAWFARACARDREARFPDGATMAAELSRALGVDATATTDASDEPPRTEGPTRPHAPAPATPEPEIVARRERTELLPLNTEAGLSQRTKPGAESPASPPRNKGLIVIATAALVLSLVGWMLHGRTTASERHAQEAPRAATPSSATSSAPASIPIGVLLDLSGERRSNGKKLLAATVAAEELVNRAGGVRGRPIRLVVKDDQGDTGAFLTEAARALLREEGLRVIVGPMTSPQVEIVAPLAQAAGVLELTGSATSPTFTTLQRPDERVLFRTLPSQTVQAEALARVMRGAAVVPFPDESADAGTTARGRAAQIPAQPVRCASVAVVATDDVAGKPFAEVFERSFAASGGRVVETRFVAAEDQASYASEIRAIARSRADCQVLVLGPKAAARYLRQAIAEPLERPDAGLPTTFACSTLATSDLIAYARVNPRDEASPSVADGVRGVRPATVQRWRPEYLELEHLLSTSDAGTDVSVSPFVANQFDAAILAALTLEAAGPDADAARLRRTLREISRGGRVYGPQELPQLLAALRRGERVDYVGASGDVDLDENGDVESDLVTWIVTGGAIVETGRVPSEARVRP
jgi:serine/threonine-protein kinase